MHSPPKLHLPLWALIHAENQQSQTEHEPCNVPSSALVFSTSGKMIAFMQSRIAGEWRVRRIADPQQLLLLLADLHSNSAPGVCFDSELDGSGGTFYLLTEFHDAVEAQGA